MSGEQELTQRIITSGSVGVKKADLRKQFAGQDIDTILEGIVARGDVCIDKKGTAYYCWHRNYYLQSLLNSDSRFRLLYEAIKTLEKSMNKTSDVITDAVRSSVSDIISDLSKLNTDNGEAAISENNPVSDNSIIQLDQFKYDFDSSISKYSNSIGWVELAKVRNQLCSRYNIPQDEFYSLVEQLVNSHNENYELSTGGCEGLTIRGLLHGYVRCI